ncbi:MAG: GIY-YIG nuclease family protein [Christensenellales bacterium]
MSKGYIYILTNPSFPDYVKIGYADDVKSRVNQLNRTECTPYAFRIYATYEVDSRLNDLKLHKMIDKLNPELRSRDEIDGKKRVREFYSLSAEDAYGIFEAMAEIHGTTDKLEKWKASATDIKQEQAARSIARQKKEKFEFSKLGIPIGAELEYIHDRSIKVVVADEKRKVYYNDEEWSLSSLARVLLQRNGTVQGTLHFSYNGETIADLRDRLEAENLYK